MRWGRFIQSQNGQRSAAILFLLAASFYYCHRIFGVYFPLEGDTPQNLYFRLFADLMAKDHNPHQWSYTSFMPYSGRFNPVIQAVTGLVSALFPTAKPVTQAMAASMGSSVALLATVAISFFAVLHLLGFSVLAATLGAVVASFNGFQTVGVLEFDHMYLLSYAAVPWALYCIVRVVEEDRPWAYSFRLALVIGVSLWGGTNSPLFLYLPLFLVGALWESRLRPRVAIPLGVAVALGCALASIILLPSIYYLGEINRSQLEFKGSALPIFEKLRTIFLSHHWRARSYFPIHETDFYIGLPVLLLAGSGVWLSFRRPALSRSYAWWLGLCVAVALLVTTFGGLPDWVAQAVAWFYSKLSIRFHSRFHMLLLFPLAYFAAHAIDQRRFIPWARLAIVPLAGMGLALFEFFQWDFPTARADVRMGAVLGIGASLVAVSCWWLLLRGHRYAAAGLLLGVFGSYVFVPSQYSRYSANFSTEGPRATWAGTLGLAWRYEDALARVEKLFEVPAGWNDPRTRIGRVYDPTDSSLRRGNFFAPKGGHRLALTLRSDPSSLRRLDRLSHEASSSVFDLMGICWTKQSDGSLAPRPDCLSDALLVPTKQCLESEEQVLSAVRSVPTPVFANVLFSQCPTDRVPAQAAVSGQLTPIFATPDRLRFEVEQELASHLFLSIPYRDDWQAEVNGEPVTVERANYAFMAVPVPAGRSVVEWRLSRRVEQWAYALTTILFVLTLFGGWSGLEPKRRARTAPRIRLRPKLAQRSRPGRKAA